MLACPKCGTQQVHLSRRKGLIEKRILATVLVRPFRCETCDFRFFHWSMSANPNSQHTMGARFQKWLHYEDDVNTGGQHKV